MKEYHLKVNGRDYVINLKNLSGDHAELDVDGKPYEVDIRSVHRTGKPTRRPSPTAQRGTTVTSPQAKALPNMAPLGADGNVTAPIPGAIIDVYVSEGDEVKSGQDLLMMEAMKMENPVAAPRDGTVGKLHVKAGDSVTQGQLLVELK